MRSKKKAGQAFSLGDSNLPEFRLLILHQDSATGHAAKLLLARLAKAFQWHSYACVNGWSIEAVTRAPLRQLATQEAIAADLILIAVHADFEPPASLRRWFEGWIPWKKDQSALVVLLNQDTPNLGTHSIIRLFLQYAAARAEMDFFCQVYCPGGAQPPLEANEPPRNDASRVYPQPPDMACRRFGRM